MSAQKPSDTDRIDTYRKQGGGSDGPEMNHPLPAPIASRIKWLSQLTAALDEAQGLLKELTLHGEDPNEVGRVRTEVLALSCEIELLRGEGFVGQHRIASDLAPPSWQWGRG